jgi:membrane protease YdiL (CAAX protease family)
MKVKIAALALTIFLALTNYQLAKLLQTIALHLFPHWSYSWTIIVPWFLICFIPAALTYRQSGLLIKNDVYKQQWKSLILYFIFVCLGLAIFVSLGITKYFHSVKSPIIFFLVTPLVEELLFRGWIYGKLRKLALYPVLGSALLFGLHHLQYFGYHPTRFALFQITYTFFLGLLFGLMRKKSGSVYPSLFTHILINFVSVYF